MYRLRFALFPVLVFLCFSVVHVFAHEGSHPGGNSQGPLNNQVDIRVEGSYRLIEANGLPDHQHGQFPNRRNPNAISSQRYYYRVPAEPKTSERLTYLGRSPFGIALNGVPFDPGTAEYWQNDPDSGWRYEALSGKIDLGVDTSHAHVQPNGAYHYHGIPTALIDKLGGNSEQMLLLGYAADGFPIYASRAYTDPTDANSGLKEMKPSYRLKEGTRPNGPRGRYDGSFTADYEYVEEAGDLDECNGRFGVTPEYPEGTYYYVLTDQYPSIPRAFKGSPDFSFKRQGPPPGGRRPGQGRPQGPPPFRNGRRPPRQ
ncbi:MAG: YHYH protein [Planctomycetaceae bacterium]|nr:YHYH protein [Planctomycetaceae bacterium]